MSFEYLRLINTITCLYDQKPVRWLPIVFLSTSPSRTPPSCVLCHHRDPPNVAFQGKLLQCGHKQDIVAPPCPPTGAMMRRKLSVLLIMLSCTMLIFLASSCATCSKASLILSKAHSAASTSFLKVFLYSSQFPPFKAMKPFFIILSVQSVSWQHFTCSKYSLAGDPSCH